MSNRPDNAFIVDAVQKYSDMLLRIAFCHVENKHDAEDIMQETFVSLITAAPGFKDGNHVKAWLIKVALNKCRDYLKSYRLKSSIPLEAIKDYGIEDKHLELFSELNRLSGEDRNIAYLFYYEDYKANEIAELLGLKETTVFVKLKRSREKLKKYIEQDKS